MAPKSRGGRDEEPQPRSRLGQKRNYVVKEQGSAVDDQSSAVQTLTSLDDPPTPRIKLAPLDRSPRADPAAAARDRLPKPDAGLPSLDAEPSQLTEDAPKAKKKKSKHAPKAARPRPFEAATVTWR